MGDVIVVTSGKGGVGKTTTTANVGTGLAQLNKKVIVIDTDIGLRNLDVMMGLANLVVYNLVDVVKGRCSAKQAMVQDKTYPNLYLLPTSQICDKSDVTPEQMRQLTEELREEFDYVILDCPAGIEQGFQNAIAGADRAIVVATPDIASIRDADRVIGMMEAAHISRPQLVVNHLRISMKKRGELMNVDDICEILGVELLGVVPDDEQIILSVNNGVPVVGSECLAGQAYKNICRRILGENVPLLNLEVKMTFREKLKFLFGDE